jgi:peroxiredoxin
MKKKLSTNIVVLIAGLVLGLGLGVLILFGCSIGGFLLGARIFSIGSDSTSTVTVGFAAPDFSLTAIDGEEIKLSSFHGRPVMINFWATWCGPCIAEMPVLETRYEQYRPDLVILAISADEPGDKVREFVDEKGLTFSVLLDPGSHTQDLYHIDAFPTSFFVDGDGIIQAEYIGSLTENQLDQYLRMVGVGK